MSLSVTTSFGQHVNTNGYIWLDVTMTSR